MRITKYIHSCLLIEKDADKILFDPGLFTFVEGIVKPSQFQNLSAIVLTHNHPDHIDADSLKQIVENNANAVVLANSEIIEKLAEKTSRRKHLKAERARLLRSFSKRLTRRTRKFSPMKVLKTRLI